MTPSSSLSPVSLALPVSSSGEAAWFPSTGESVFALVLSFKNMFTCSGANLGRQRGSSTALLRAWGAKPHVPVVSLQLLRSGRPSAWENSTCGDNIETRWIPCAPSNFGAFRITRKALGFFPIWAGREGLRAACCFFPPNSLALRAYPGPGLNLLDVYGNYISVSMYPPVILALSGLENESDSSCFALFF